MTVSARAEEDDLRTLQLYNGPQVEIVSTNRSPRPASQTAENITVVTAHEIETLNAHTLADLLYTVSGVQLQMLRTPGTVSNVEIQGATFQHILVLIDNVPINNLADNYPDIGSVPVQMIDRLEIVKGAASSSWGSALGGVVNIITKFPYGERPVGGMVSGSAGKSFTADLRGELSGTVRNLGYYLTGGKLRSDGLLPNNRSDQRNLYGKLHYDLPGNGWLMFTTFLTDGSTGMVRVDTPAFVAEAEQENSLLISTLSLQYPLAERLTLDASLRGRESTGEISTSLNSPAGVTMNRVKDEESGVGASLKVSRLDELQRIVAGVDYDHVNVHLSQPIVQANILRRSADRVGIYLIDTITLGDFAITPSARFDHTDTGGDLFSPSLGVTYALTENSVLRGYAARGYSLTSLNRTSSTERVLTAQIGVETSDIPYLWLKGTLFRNETWDIQYEGRSGQEHIKQGYELEARTLPYLGTSLSLGYTFLDARDHDSDQVLRGVARHTLNLGIKYEDPRYLRALLNGHYIDWNIGPGGGGQDDIIWDLYLGKEFPYSDTGAVEIFLSVRNLFNGEQYIDVYQNPARWGEVGVRCEF